jgi:hypothetical protein
VERTVGEDPLQTVEQVARLEAQMVEVPVVAEQVAVVATAAEVVAARSF